MKLLFCTILMVTGGLHCSFHNTMHHPEPPPLALNIFVNHRHQPQAYSKLYHFWKSTGFCPPLPHNESSTWFLSTDMKHNLAYIGALPFSGIQQVRVHWLLDAVNLQSSRRNQYNFTLLDEFIEDLWKHDLYPGFEVMGNPGNQFSNFENKTQVYLWRDYISEMVQHYIDVYGLDYVSSWNFESWNEPMQHRFDDINVTIPGFLNYYDATAEALSSVSGKLRLGAPGGACHTYKPNSYCWALLNHTVHGRSIFTRDKPPPIHYISIHKKGEEPENTVAMIRKENDFYSQLVTSLPELADLPIYNECEFNFKQLLGLLYSKEIKNFSSA